ncbi:peptidase [Candidatus Williamhamiltonella defendens]|uniref:Phage lysis protein, endopeptidase n=2 Tax=Candidatus Williamhamiltonella defendens TaxID=138072 RepID=C4K688_HAMD5|nr:phage lysis protein, endopeptidase [Candidatus Hamiltonella defensa 5AT (Acyrthosiphon pisum)]ATW22690.1 peptidase [Candidatus Hamiltonella defensa]
MRWQFPIVAGLIVSVLGVTLYYRTLYYDAEKARKIAVSDREKQQVAFEQLSHQMQTISALDTQHTKALEHDKKLITQLERDVATSRRRLQVNATCPAMPTGSPASSLDDATRSRPTDAAQRNYFTLRRRIEIAEEQINGLQDYVQHVCLAAISKDLKRNKLNERK